MREILYFQAGRFSNFIGSHFWNAQESYFTYGEDAEEPLVDHDVSFREGLNHQGEPTFCPRLLLFDRKSNFGALSDVYGDSQGDTEDITAEWDGEAVKYRSEPIRRSDYRVQLETEGDENRINTDDHAGKAQVKESKIRYWSDYSRINVHPRSLQRLPDPPDWEDAEGDWVNGTATFQKYDEDNDFIEDSFRVFVEECDNLQGLQLMNDSLTFGGFTHSFLTRFRDDFTKLSCLSFPILSEFAPGNMDVDDAHAVKKAFNDALFLQSLSELSTLTIPIQPPSLWSPDAWTGGLNLRLDSIYQTSAVLATHIEDITLPMRFKYNHADLPSIVSSLSWRSDTLFASLQGAFPLPDAFNAEKDAERKIYDFSVIVRDSSTRLDPKATYARMNVSRGFSEAEKASFSQWAERFRPEPYSLYAPTLTLPSSFPRFFTSSLTPFPSPSSPHQAKALSSLSSGASLSSLFASYASVAKDCLGRHSDVATRMGLESDDVKELRDALWALEDAYKADEQGSDSDELGEDEET